MPSAITNYLHQLVKSPAAADQLFERFTTPQRDRLCLVLKNGKKASLPYASISQLHHIEGADENPEKIIIYAPGQFYVEIEGHALTELFQALDAHEVSTLRYLSKERDPSEQITEIKCTFDKSWEERAQLDS